MKRILDFYSVPRNFFILILLLQAAFWTCGPYYAFKLLPLDALEAIVWGQDFTLGNVKHPPLTGWLAGLFAWPGDDVLLYLLSQLLVVCAFLFTYRLAREFFSRTLSIVATLSLVFVVYYNFTTPEYNVNKPQIALWPAAAYFFVHAARSGSLKHWIGFGIAAGLCILTKYYCLMLFCALFAWLASTPDVRKSLRSFGPYLGIGIAALIALPHLLWLVDNDFLPFAYAKERMSVGGDPWWMRRIVAPFEYVGSQIGLLAVPAALILLTFWKTGFLSFSNWRARKDSLRLALFLSGVPLAVQFALMVCFGAGAHTMWCEPVFFSFGILMMSFAPQEEPSPRVAHRFELAVLIIFILHFATFSAIALCHTSKRRHLPACSVANTIMANARSRLGVGAMPDVVGSPWTAGIMLRYQKNPTRAAIAADPTQMRALEKGRDRGRIYVMEREKRLRELLASAGRDDLMIHELRVPVQAPFGKWKETSLFYAIDPPKQE